ncbi:uncharacterized protein LOC143446271 isoform X1 [Clavelina lepadiformis]|uniref:uncharacterized protein LOC143446271 isoform X1 n=1 Tax=Clavelina lepadiformis TaxID=159417 RepID=UPI004041BCC3
MAENLDGKLSDGEESPEEKTPRVPSFSGSRKSSAKSVKSTLKDVVDDFNEESHIVTLTITVAVAYPKPDDDHSKLMEELVRRNKRTVEAPRASQYFHCEYTMAPKHDRTLTDVVTYGVAAKVFTETDYRVVKTWDDGKNLWVAWMHRHEVEITPSNVTSLYNHVVDLKIWDTKDKVSVKARTDRPKAFRLPSVCEVTFPGKGVYGVVARQSSSWLSVQPRNSVEDVDKFPGLSASKEEQNIEEKEKRKVKKEETSVLRVRSSLGRLAGINASDEEKKRINELKRQQAKLQKELMKNKKSISTKGGVNEPKPEQASALKENRELEADDTPVNPSEKKNRAAETKNAAVSARTKPTSIMVKLEGLFAGVKSVTSRLVDPNGSVLDGLVTVSVNGPLLPEELDRSLNPMVINLRAVKDLPKTPIPYRKLAEICKPVYCKYAFLGNPAHVTAGRSHGKDVFFEDTHVILLGRLNEGEIRGFIQSNSLQVEVHDRDQKGKTENGSASLFGEERFDNKLSNVGVISAKRTTQNAFQSRNKAYDPFGVAKISLTDILRGCTSLNLQASVNPCPIPDVLKDPPGGTDMPLVGVVGAVDRPERPPQPPGHYIQAGTTLKLKITLRYPFVSKENVPRLLPPARQTCPFSRVVYYFSYKNKELLHRLEDFVTRTNATALKLDHFEKNIMDAALSTYKLTSEQKRSRTLDIITGFHVIDGNLHLMVLEGLREGAMQGLLDQVQRTESEDPSNVIVHLYDTSMSFSHRLYASLDVDLCRIRLHQSIPEIMSQPLLYVRDVIPRASFDCLVKIQQITKLGRLRDVIHSDLFPTSEMVISMSREFGIPLTYDDFEQLQKTQPQKDVEVCEPEVLPEPEMGRKWTPISYTNPAYDSMLKKRHKEAVKLSHITTNILAVQEAGKRRRPLYPTIRSLTADVAAHNYSTQTLNTTELAKDMLRDVLRKEDPNARYAYHPVYNSAMLVPVNVDAYHKEQDEAARRAWRTADGFSYPGMRNSQTCNEHPLKPDDSRISDLKLRFRDNVLHKNILEPTTQRDRMKWDERHRDMELYKKPGSHFGDSPPVTIHLAGYLKKLEEQQQKRAEVERWRSRVIVDDPRMNFHRVLPATEQTNSSNQLDRLTSLLKNEPKKLSLKRPPAPSIPPLSVVLNQSVDTASREKGVKLPPAFDESREKHHGFAPGPFDEKGWTLEINKIPIKDEEHGRFAKIHGHDMNRYHKERTLLSIHRPINPLTDEEKKTHLFQIPSIPEKNSEKMAKEEVPKDAEFGEGPHKKSEYRHKFIPHESGPRLREIYPRHTFEGVAPLDKDGKPVNRDASIHLLAADKNLIEQLEMNNKKMLESARSKPGSTLQNEASVEIAPQSATPMPVQVA